MLASKGDATFPSKNTFERFGPKRNLARVVVAFCETNSGNGDAAALWKPLALEEERLEVDDSGSNASSVGFVCLLKHGSRREYKIGRTNNVIRREGEISLQLPEKLQPVHYIETDDPTGVESYWHNRFADKRMEGEWFELSPQDVRAFKRWKRIY